MDLLVVKEEIYIKEALPFLNLKDKIAEIDG